MSGISGISVRTGDRDPTFPPHRISTVTQRDTATVTVRILAPAPGIMPSSTLVPRGHLQPGQQYNRAVTIGDLANPHQPKYVGLGIVCGTGVRCGPDARSLALSVAKDLPLPITYAKFAQVRGSTPVPGDYELYAAVADDMRWTA